MPNQVLTPTLVPTLNLYPTLTLHPMPARPLILTLSPTLTQLLMLSLQLTLIPRLTQSRGGRAFILAATPTWATTVLEALITDTTHS